MAPSRACILLTTCKDMREAKRIATSLVRKRLVACVNMVSVKSIYRWKGRMESADEVLLVMKSRQDMFQRVQSQLKKLHSYDLPELISVPIRRGYKPYLDWLLKSVAL